MDDGTGYRVGSPFAADTATDTPANNASEPAGNGSASDSTNRLDGRKSRPEPIDDGLSFQTTAAAALLASALLSPFAIAGLLIFPAGGLTVALLGLSVAMIGTSSRHRLASTTAILTHVALSVACYWRL